MALFGDHVPKTFTVHGNPLRCEMCENQHFWHREAQLHTAVATFFSLGWAQPTADCYVCAHCGYIHWFLPVS